jgi:hypothetical protein
MTTRLANEDLAEAIREMSEPIKVVKSCSVGMTGHFPAYNRLPGGKAERMNWRSFRLVLEDSR